MGTAGNFVAPSLLINSKHLALLQDFRPFLAGVLAPRLIFLGGLAASPSGSR